MDQEGPTSEELNFVRTSTFLRYTPCKIRLWYSRLAKASLALSFRQAQHLVSIIRGAYLQGSGRSLPWRREKGNFPGNCPREKLNGSCIKKSKSEKRLEPFDGLRRVTVLNAHGSSSVVDSYRQNWPVSQFAEDVHVTVPSRCSTCHLPQKFGYSTAAATALAASMSFALSFVFVFVFIFIFFPCHVCLFRANKVVVYLSCIR